MLPCCLAAHEAQLMAERRLELSPRFQELWVRSYDMTRRNCSQRAEQKHEETTNLASTHPYPLGNSWAAS